MRNTRNDIAAEGRIKQRVQRIIVSCSVILMAGKFLAYYLTNSVGILTDALESIVNVSAGLISLYALMQAAKPKDAKHPFGHGKVELISASIEGIMIFVAGLWIIFEGVQRLITPGVIGKLDVGIVIIALAGVANFLLGAYSIRIGKKYNSVALVASGRHLQSDTYSTIGLVAGLLLLYFTGIVWIDSALALIYGPIIAFTGISILRKTGANLMDEADKGDLQKILFTLNENHSPEWIDIHNMKIIKYGSYLYIDCDVTLPWYYNIRQGHDTCMKLERVIAEKFADRVIFSVHSDSCEEKHCDHCAVFDCPYRREAFVAPLVLTLKELTESDEERNE